MYVEISGTTYSSIDVMNVTLAALHSFVHNIQLLFYNLEKISNMIFFFPNRTVQLNDQISPIGKSGLHTTDRA